MATIVKRGASWQAKVRRKGWPTHSATFDRKSEAQDWARSVEDQMRRGLHIDRAQSERTLLGEVFSRYRHEITPSHRGGAVESYRLAAWEREHPLRDRAIATIRTEDVARWRDVRIAAGANPETVIYELSLLHRVIEQARNEWGLHLHDNPADRRVRRPRKAPSRERRLNPGEYILIRKAARTERTDWIWSAIVLAVETGMRRGEILALHWDHIDPQHRVATLRETKNGESRSVPLSRRALVALRRLGPAQRGMVFPVTAEGFKTAWRRCRGRAQAETGAPALLAGLRFHDLRHEATTRFFEKGLNVMEVASITGHKDLRMLKRYTHMNAADLARRLR